MINFHRTTNKAAGFTLLEVLIAIVIFSVGLMGIAGLQVNGMRFTHDSQLRAIAIAQAESLADRMRADPVGVQNGFYNIGAGKTMPTMSTAGLVNCYAATCNSQQLAQFTLAKWNSQLPATQTQESNAAMLPSGDGVVCIDSTPNDGTSVDWKCDGIGTVYAIKVSWAERLADKNDAGSATNTDVKTAVVLMTPYAVVPGDHLATTVL